MPISGPVVHQQLIDSLNRFQSQYEIDRSELAGRQQVRSRVDQSRGDAMVELAKYYLPELTPDAISETWLEVRSRIATILQRQKTEIEKLAGDLATQNQNRRQFDEQLVSLNRDLDEALERQDEMTQTSESRLAADPEFVRLSESAAKAESAIERAEANLNEIEQDAATKLPAYQQSTLFQYLLQRNFGTPQYKSRGFTRRMDRSVARLVGYADAIQGYRFLKETPEQMRQIIAEDRQSLSTVMSELERRRDIVAEEVGLVDQIKLVGEKIRDRESLIEQVNQSMEKIDQLQNKISDAQDTRGPYYHEAIGVFRKMLDGFQTDDLQQRAQRTIDITDDQIVARIDGAEQQIEDLDEIALRRRDQLTKRQALLSELGNIIKRFRAAGFDSGRSQFVGSLDVVGSLEQAIRDGESDPGAMERFWDSVRSSQRWGPTAMDKITNVATHPMTQVLLNAMAHAAGAAMQNAARNAGRRGGRSGSFGNRRRGGSNRNPWGDRSW